MNGKLDSESLTVYCYLRGAQFSPMCCSRLAAIIFTSTLTMCSCHWKCCSNSSGSPALWMPSKKITTSASPQNFPEVQSWHWNKMPCNHLFIRKKLNDILKDKIRPSYRFSGTFPSPSFSHFMLSVSWRRYRCYEAVTNNHKWFSGA